MGGDPIQIAEKGFVAIKTPSIELNLLTYCECLVICWDERYTQTGRA
jgi:hypothetical protein